MLLRVRTDERMPSPRLLAEPVRRPFHDVKQPISFPRRVFAPEFCIVASLTPNRGVGGAPRNVRVRAKHPLGLHMTRQARRLARRLASHNAGRSPLGAPPWRFWALRVPRFPPRRPPQLVLRQADRLQRAPRVQVLVPGGRGPYLPGQRLRAATAGRHTSLRIQDASRTRPLRARLQMYYVSLSL